MIVVDASVLATVVAVDSGAGDLVRARLARESSLHAPHLVDVEVLSVLRKRHRTGKLDERRVELALRDLEEIPIFRHPHLPFVRRGWDLRKTVTPYDAVYVALAEVLGCPLVTSDARLSNASGVRCPVEVLLP